MSKSPKKPTPAAEDPIDALLAKEPEVTSAGNDAELLDTSPIELAPADESPVKAAAFMSEDPNEVVAALKASLPALNQVEPAPAPTKLIVPDAPGPIVKVNAKTLAEMQRGRELIERYK